jgi:hypothetical protein
MDKKMVAFDFCGKRTLGGIARAKKYQMGIKGAVGCHTEILNNIKLILKVPFDVRCTKIFLECQHLHVCFAYDFCF